MTRWKSKHIVKYIVLDGMTIKVKSKQKQNKKRINQKGKENQ